MRQNPLREWRKARRLSAVEIARRLSLSEQSILCFERGAFEPSPENFDRLARLMGTLPGQLRMSWHFWKRELNGGSSAAS